MPENTRTSSQDKDSKTRNDVKDTGRVVAGGDKGELDIAPANSVPAPGSTIAAGVSRPHGSR